MRSVITSNSNDCHLHLPFFALRFLRHRLQYFLVNIAVTCAGHSHRCPQSTGPQGLPTPPLPYGRIEVKRGDLAGSSL